MTIKNRKWQEAEERIYQIAADLNNRPTPAHIVEDARNEISPLHPFFDWNDETAAAAARLETARRLLRRVKIEIQINERVVAAPGFYRDPDLDCHEQGFVGHPVVAGDDGMATRVCWAEFDRARSVLKRAIVSAQSLEVNCADGQKALGYVEKMIKRLAV